MTSFVDWIPGLLIAGFIFFILIVATGDDESAEEDPEAKHKADEDDWIVL